MASTGGIYEELHVWFSDFGGRYSSHDLKKLIVASKMELFDVAFTCGSMA